MNELRFTVQEYLKGSGASEVVIVVRDEDTHVSQGEALSRAQDRLKQRQTTWDEREAVLFMKAGEPYQSGAARSPAPALEFTQSNYPFQSPFDYSIDTLSRVWLPARDAAGTATRSADPEYITDGSASPPPTISLAGLRSKIADLRTTLESGAGIDGFRDCIRRKIYRERIGRASPWTPVQFEVKLA